MIDNPCVVGMSFDIAGEPPSRIQFKPDTPPDEVSAVCQAADAYDWKDVQIDFKSFSEEIASDTTVLTRVMRVNLTAQLPAWEKNLWAFPEVCKSDWEEMKTEGWLTPEAIAKIESWALDFNVPIV